MLVEGYPCLDLESNDAIVSILTPQPEQKLLFANGGYFNTNQGTI